MKGSVATIPFSVLETSKLDKEHLTSHKTDVDDEDMDVLVDIVMEHVQIQGFYTQSWISTKPKLDLDLAHLPNYCLASSA